MTEERSLFSLFKGRKAKWLPLFRRLMARFSVSGVEMSLYRAAVRLLPPGESARAIGFIRCKPEGLMIELALKRAAIKSDRLLPFERKSSRMTHRVLITEAREIDDELLLWIRAAKLQARTARR